MSRNDSVNIAGGGGPQCIEHWGALTMKYLLKTAMVVGVVIAGSVVLANLAFDLAGVQTILAGVGVQGLFVGLVTSGLVGALLTNEYWLTA